MTSDSIVSAVSDLYQWLDCQIVLANNPNRKCSGCGDCCNFAEYDHRLYVTSVELAHFKHHISPIPIKPMAGDICPYQIENKCSVYPHRFVGCRIFCCTGDSVFQNQLSEQTLSKLKAICQEFNQDYLYSDLATILNRHAL